MPPSQDVYRRCRDSNGRRDGLLVFLDLLRFNPHYPMGRHEHGKSSQHVSALTLMDQAVSYKASMFLAVKQSCLPMIYMR